MLCQRKMPFHSVHIFPPVNLAFFFMTPLIGTRVWNRQVANGTQSKKEIAKGSKWSSSHRQILLERPSKENQMACSHCYDLFPEAKRSHSALVTPWGQKLLFISYVDGKRIYVQQTSTASLLPFVLSRANIWFRMNLLNYPEV